MLLKIQTLSCPPPDTPESIQAQFGAAGGRIGRSPPCTLILPDPNRHISREHAEVRFRGDGFSLKVVSKVNSVVVNDAVVGPGEAVPLHDGDQILIGEYLLRATILPSVAAPPPAPSFFAPPPPASAVGSPFDMFEGLGAARPAAAAPEPAPDWFRAPPAAVPPPPVLAGDGMADFFNPTAEGRAFADLLKTTPPPSHPEVFAPPASVAPADTRLDDFLGLHDPTALGATGALGAGSADLYRVSPLDMPLQSAAVPVKPSSPAPLPTPSTHDDIFKALEQDFSALVPPAAPLAPPSAPLPSAAVSMPAPVIAPRVPSVPVAPPMPVAPSFQTDPAPPPFQPPAAPLPVAQALPGDDIPTMRLTPAAVPAPPLAMPAVAAGPVSAGASMAPFPSLPVEPVAETAPAQSEAAAEAARQQMLSVLVEAMGLNPSDVDTSDPEQTIRLVGELLRLSTDGLFRLLEMRSQLKSELHIEDRTMIASRENNPLKHADTARDAIAYLVDRRQHGNKLFMPPVKAVEDTIWDICAHEMAVMAGTRAALLAALKMFSPEVIEGLIKKSGALENVLPALYKSRLWERFLGMYAELQTEAEDHFDRLLNQEFSKAYTEQSKKLKKKR